MSDENDYKASKLGDVVTMVDLDDRLAIAEAAATQLRGLIQKIVEESFLDVENQTWQWSCSQKEFDELATEVGK